MAQEPVTRITLADHDLGATIGIGHVEVRRITIAPGVQPGAHWHNGPVFGVIEQGSVYVQIGEDAERVLGPGDTFYEPPRATITRFDATSEGVTFLGWFPLPGDERPELTMGPAEGREGRASA